MKVLAITSPEDLRLIPKFHGRSREWAPEDRRPLTSVPAMAPCTIIGGKEEEEGGERRLRKELVQPEESPSGT